MRFTWVGRKAALAVLFFSACGRLLCERQAGRRVTSALPIVQALYDEDLRDVVR